MKINGIFSMPVSRKRQVSMERKFIIFAMVLFLLIFVIGSGTFFVLMRRILHDNAGNELSKILELERFKLEASVNSEIAIVVKMATSPLLLRYFLDQNNPELEKMALEDIDGYRLAFVSNSLFWVNDTDKKFYIDEASSYILEVSEAPDFVSPRLRVQTTAVFLLDSSLGRGTWY
jgi:methyl-accepting chemotaxis protein